MGISEKSVAKNTNWKFKNDCLLTYYSTVFVLYKDFCDLAH